MAALQTQDLLDDQFYQPADRFFATNQGVGLTYDDVTLATLFSELLPRDTQLDTTLSPGLHLHIPIVSSDMDTVTEARMAIAMALNGGLGLIHYNMPPRQQLKEVGRVKNHVHGLIQDPITIGPGLLVGDVVAMMEEKNYTFSTFPVVESGGQLTGLLPGSVVKARYGDRSVDQAMIPRDQVHTIRQKERDGASMIRQHPVSDAFLRLRVVWGPHNLRYGVKQRGEHIGLVVRGRSLDN